jgi:hypothetical protein
MSYIQAINNVTWVQVNPDISNNTNGNIEDYVVDYLYASNNNLLIGAYSSNPVDNSNPNPYCLSGLNISGGGGGYDLSGGDISGGWYTNMYNYLDETTYTIPTISNITSLECIYINYSNGFQPSSSEPIYGIRNFMFDITTEELTNNSIYITNEDTTGNTIYFSNICISNELEGSYLVSFAIENNNQNIFFNYEIPYLSAKYNSNTNTNNWQNITNYVLNCDVSFTYFETVPSDTYSGIPNFTSVSTSTYGVTLVVSANDDTYGGIYYLQCPQGCSSFEPNTKSKNNDTPLIDGVVGIKFPINDSNANPITSWDYCTYQNLTNGIDVSLNDNYQNYIVCVESNNVYKIAFDFITSTDYTTSKDYCIYSISNPNILDLSGESCEINGNITSLISNIDAPNVVVFITPTQFFISDDTGNHFYNIPISELSTNSSLTSCAISSGSSSSSSSSSSKTVTYIVSIFLGTNNGSIYQVVTDISGVIQPRTGPVMSKSSGRFLSWLTTFLIDYHFLMQTLQANQASGYKKTALNYLFIFPIIMSCWRFYNIKRTFVKFFGLIIACILYLFLVLGFQIGRGLSYLIGIIGKYIPEVGIVKLGSYFVVGMTRALNYLIVLLRKTFNLIDDIYLMFYPLKEEAISEGVTKEELLSEFDFDEDGEGPRHAFDFGGGEGGGEGGEGQTWEKYLTDWIIKDATYIFDCFKYEVLVSIILNLAGYAVFLDYFNAISINPTSFSSLITLITNDNLSTSQSIKVAFEDISDIVTINDLSFNYFRMKLYIYFYDIQKIKKGFGDMYGDIENFVTNILSNKITTYVPNSNVEKSLYYIQLIMVTIWVFIIYLIIFWRKNMYRLLSWASIKGGYTNPDDGGEGRDLFKGFATSGEDKKEETKSFFEGLKEIAPILGDILTVIAIIFVIDWLICFVIYYIYIIFINPSGKQVPYIVVRWENFVKGFLWYIKEIQTGIGKLFELIFRKILADIANSGRIAQLRENIQSKKQDFSGNDVSGNDVSGNDLSDNDDGDY